MEGCGLAITVTALALAVAAQIEHAEDLGLLAAAATQLGDTLALLALERERSEGQNAAADTKAKEDAPTHETCCAPLNPL